ncbi:MAG: hypothetical protein EPN14_03795 [Gallionella sp.]|nr:MAG: hypothetical protein EPN14_03795 [Gallionella sp.]
MWSKKYVGMILLIALLPSPALADSAGPGTQATNQGSVVNTRHNLTQSFTTLGGWMDTARNNYGEVCVYCHTPHASNRQIAAPLWNRTIVPTSFTVYNTPTTLGRPITQPGVSSLVCLSCHDGVTAVDSVINIPGSGRYNASQETVVSQAFLSSWKLEGKPGPLSPGHAGIQTCTDRCHNSSIFSVRTNLQFDVFVIGTDLMNDHPVGVQYPTSFGADVDFRAPTGELAGKMKFFDTNGNSRADVNEVRMYDSGEGYEVECASCHDPHGVPSAGPGSTFNPSFLRVSNTSSTLCLACHTK